MQFFLWLLSKNKLLTRDNLAKRRGVSDATCLLCVKSESINHLFFECCIAKLNWECISELLDLGLGQDFESVARFWVANKRHKVTNTVSSAVLWSIWKFQNELCFQGRKWMGVKDMLIKIAKMLRRWVPMMDQEMGEDIKRIVIQLELKASLPPQLMWHNLESLSSRSGALDVQITVSSAAPNLREENELVPGHELLADRRSLHMSEVLPLG